ncbi:MAG: carboxypeptidase-like regulatory domain-containing protein, partial [Pyrinomonadaceae bacterium]
MNKLLLSILLVSVGSTSVQASSIQRPEAPQKPLVTLRGRVVDARTSEPMGKVRVIASGTEQSTTTDDNGAFTLENLPLGNVDLYITTVNYGLVKKTITIKDSENPEALIALNEDAAALTEHVVVTDDPFASTEANAASEQTLNKRELQALSSVLLGDPVRAAQALPGATANDDFRSEFSIRGAGFDRVGLYLDGILTENFVHTVAGGFPDTGSLSVINADTVSAVSLLSGGFPSKYGYRSAGILDVVTRDGNRVKPAGRIAASLSGLSGLVDGPFAKSRGSYLFAGRKSYVGYLVRSINDENNFTNNPPILNFADAQGKALYDLNSRNQIGFSLIFGAFDFDRNRDRALLGINQVSRADTNNLLVNGHWTFTPNPQVFWQTRLFGLRTNFENTNRNDASLQNGHRSQYGLRSDVAFQLRPRHRIEAGLYIRSLNVDSTSQFFDFADEVAITFGNFNRHGTEEAFYAQDTWTNERLRLSLTGGGRVEHSSTTRETVFSPRASLGWSPA